jgi:hypothetical protein
LHHSGRCGARRPPTDHCGGFARPTRALLSGVLAPLQPALAAGAPRPSNEWNQGSSHATGWPRATRVPHGGHLLHQMCGAGGCWDQFALTFPCRLAHGEDDSHTLTVRVLQPPPLLLAFPIFEATAAPRRERPHRPGMCRLRVGRAWGYIG